eukprot:2438159-Prymnesium_polylepis.2
MAALRSRSRESTQAMNMYTRGASSSAGTAHGTCAHKLERLKVEPNAHVDEEDRVADAEADESEVNRRCKGVHGQHESCSAAVCAGSGWHASRQAVLYQRRARQPRKAGDHIFAERRQQHAVVSGEHLSGLYRSPFRSFAQEAGCACKQGRGWGAWRRLARAPDKI